MAEDIITGNAAHKDTLNDVASNLSDVPTIAAAVMPSDKLLIVTGQLHLKLFNVHLPLA